MALGPCQSVGLVHGGRSNSEDGRLTEITGLVSDNHSLREERLTLWREFNLCWLAVLQRQKDDAQLMFDTGQAPPPPRNILGTDMLERMGDALVEACDGIEKYGLVDYQMGVWEEEIMTRGPH